MLFHTFDCLMPPHNVLYNTSLPIGICHPLLINDVHVSCTKIVHTSSSNIGMFKFQKWRCWCHDPNFSLTTKIRAWKGVGRECNLGVTPTLPGVQKNVREWPHTLLSELSFWELKSLWIPEFLESNLIGQNSLN